MHLFIIMKDISDSYLFINEQGKIIRLNCPFRVTFTEDNLNKIYLVKGVLYEEDNIILFQIEEQVFNPVKFQLLYERGLNYIKLNKSIFVANIIKVILLN